MVVKMDEACINFGDVNLQQVKGKYYWVYIPRVIIENLGLTKGAKVQVTFYPEKREIVLKA
jgi:hypothetical protein